MTISSILIANRGEIACRIIRTARDLGIRTIAVYSTADAGAPHVKAADDSVLIGPDPASESYLSIEKIIEAAKQTGAEAIHPGYGFLSENADFAKAVTDAGLIFIGPPASAIAAMGNKAEAKGLMLKAGVPCVPGYQSEDQSDDTLAKAAADIGYPLMIKAAAGGGGRGMRIVREEKQLAEALASARSEAESAFGSGELILEKAVTNARHVEIQVFADTHGNCIHLGERDCSVQRRHQKIIEEAPSPAVDAELRKRMGAAAVEAARAVNYVGAGTVEFLLDADGSFYFLEMNTRLQVEHPVTEMITGFDLVEWQIAVADGEKLPVTQDEVSLDGHAIEVRLYAEDPANDFMPSAGLLRLWQPPFGFDTRVDDGVEPGQEISSLYDPLLAKIIVHGKTRREVLAKLTAALGKTVAFGPGTNRDFLINVLENETFANGEATTVFLDQQFTSREVDDDTDTRMAAVAGMLAFLDQRANAIKRAGLVSGQLLNWSSACHPGWRINLANDDDAFPVAVTADVSSYDVSVSGADFRIEMASDDGARVRLTVNQSVMVISYLVEDDDIFISTPRLNHHFNIRSGNAAADTGGGAAGHVTAPMHGRLLELNVAGGDRVEMGQTLAILEAMKMQHRIKSEVGGTVTAILGEAGAQVAAGQLLLEIEPEEAQ